MTFNPSFAFSLTIARPLGFAVNIVSGSLLAAACVAFAVASGVVWLDDLLSRKTS